MLPSGDRNRIRVYMNMIRGDRDKIIADRNRIGGNIEMIRQKGTELKE